MGKHAENAQVRRIIYLPWIKYFGHRTRENVVDKDCRAKYNDPSFIFIIYHSSRWIKMGKKFMCYILVFFSSSCCGDRCDISTSWVANARVRRTLSQSSTEWRFSLPTRWLREADSGTSWRVSDVWRRLLVKSSVLTRWGFQFAFECWSRWGIVDSLQSFSNVWYPTNCKSMCFMFDWMTLDLRSISSRREELRYLDSLLQSIWSAQLVQGIPWYPHHWSSRSDVYVTVLSAHLRLFLSLVAKSNPFRYAFFAA